MVSLCAVLLKIFCGHAAQVRRKLEYLSTLKISGLTEPLRALFDCLMSVSGYGLKRIFKELTDFIADNCRRSPPSAQNRKLLKDFPLLVRAFNNARNPWRKKIA